jgi:uncharacterized membrane protein
VQSVLDTPLIADAADRARIVDAEFDDAPPRVVDAVPRVLTSATRKKLGLPAAKVPPYRFAFIALLCVLIGVPMLLLAWFKATFALVFVSLGLVPGVRWFEKREIELRDRVFTHGLEVVARVLDVEPGGPDRNGKVVRLEFLVGEQRIAASVFGCPFARKGLEPGDDVVVYHAPDEPHRCLIVERIARKVSPRARPIPRPQGGCGNGACGAGGCGDGACGAGGCGGGGCGGGGCG